MLYKVGKQDTFFRNLIAFSQPTSTLSYIIILRGKKMNLTYGNCFWIIWFLKWINDKIQKLVLKICAYCFRAGYKLTVIDAVSDKDWWKGKCFGAVGVFPSNYVTQLHPGEKPLQVTQTVQINATSMQEPPIKLLRDQVLTILTIFLRYFP